jgi:hypothetical protein
MKQKILMLGVVIVLGACSKTEAPTPHATTGKDSHPVKNVEALPSGTIREGANTMNRASDMSQDMEQQKDDRDKEMEKQTK